MKLFTCQHCQQLLYFENVVCTRCGHQLGYLPEHGELSAMEPDGDAWRPLLAPDSRYHYCANSLHGACNWLVPADGDNPFCTACSHNRTIPDISAEANLALWQNLQISLHRLFYTIMKLRLPYPTKVEDEATGLAFDVLVDAPDGSAPVLTGHDNGLITINLAEADDAEREKRRAAMGEPYRTLLGHFRHEVGHYYWDRLVRDAGQTDAFRAVFGDESVDYAQALQTHYANGPVPDWQSSFVSSYAAVHPWEDWAETWAHYLHIVDTLETASAFRLWVDPKAGERGELAARVDFDVYAVQDIQTIIDAWLPMAFAINSLNRSMGQQDLYPFVISEPVIAKLGFIHALLHQQQG